MKRRSLFGFLALLPLASCLVHATPPKRHLLHQAPTMDQLINLAENGTGDRRYAKKVLLKALAYTDWLAYDKGRQGIDVYFAGPSICLSNRDGIGIPFKSAVTTLVPVEALPNIPLANRGMGFPPGIPFVELK